MTDTYVASNIIGRIFSRFFKDLYMFMMYKLLTMHTKKSYTPLFCLYTTVHTCMDVSGEYTYILLSVNTQFGR